MILLDSNVLVAALVESHPHHEASNILVDAATAVTTMVAAHSLAEVYSTLTRSNRPYRVAGAVASSVIETLAESLTVAALSVPQTRYAIRRFAALGIGPRIYDFLIGTTAETFGADTIVTWNTRDFDGLFPALRIVTPAALLPTLP